MGGSGDAINKRIEEARRQAKADLRRAFGPELALLPEPDCVAMLRIMEAVLDFDCWGRMRELEKLPFAQAHRAWRSTVDWVLDARTR
jgi:hypothetical protein